MTDASIQTTMDTYVRVIEESLDKAIAAFEAHPDLQNGTEENAEISA